MVQRLGAIVIHREWDPELHSRGTSTPREGCCEVGTIFPNPSAWRDHLGRCPGWVVWIQSPQHHSPGYIRAAPESVQERRLDSRWGVGYTDDPDASW